MALPVLDLTKPGKFWALAENEETSTFHVVVSSKQYSKRKLLDNPTINPKDELMTPFSVSHRDTDDNGLAVFDLKESGRATEITRKLQEFFEELSDLSRFNDAYHLAQNLLSGTLFFIARTSGQQEQIESLQQSAMSAEFQNLEESNTFFMTGSPLPGHQPLGLRYPANGKNRLFHMVNRRRLLRRHSRDQGRAIIVAVVEPWEDRVGQVTPVATIFDDDDQNHWGLTAPASWIDANGADPDQWRNPTTAYLMSPGLLVGDGWQSPVHLLDDPS